MTPFETAFPGFIQACIHLFNALMPFSLPILIIGVALEFWHESPTVEAALKTFIKVFLILVLLSESSKILNEGQMLVKGWVETNVPARPENVAERYREKLREAQQQGDKGDQSFLDQILSGNFFEAIIAALLTLISLFAMALMAYIYSIQRIALYACWTLSPLLIPCLAVRPLFGIGLQHILRMIGIMLWPLGLAVAATFTDGLIDAMASGTAFSNAGYTEQIGKGFTGLLGVGILAVWIIFSTVVAPYFIQKLVTNASFSVGAIIQNGNGLVEMVGGAAGFAGMAYNRYQANSAAARDYADDEPESGDGAGSDPSALSSPPQPVPPEIHPNTDSTTMSSSQLSGATQPKPTGSATARVDSTTDPARSASVDGRPSATASRVPPQIQPNPVTQTGTGSLSPSSATSLSQDSQHTSVVSVTARTSIGASGSR